jgi:hypothetical protein
MEVEDALAAMEVEEPPFPSLDDDTAHHVLSFASPSALVAASATCKLYSDAAARCWPCVLESRFSLRVADATAARKRFAIETSWTSAAARTPVKLPLPSSRLPEMHRPIAVGVDAPRQSFVHVCGEAAWRMPLPGNETLEPVEQRPTFLTQNISATAVCSTAVAWGALDGRVEVANAWPDDGADAWRREYSTTVSGATISSILVVPAADGSLLVVSGNRVGRLHYQRLRESPPGSDPMHTFAPNAGPENCAITAIAADHSAPPGSPLLVGGWAGHVELVDVAEGKIIGGALSSCACQPCALAYDVSSAMLACSRRHSFIGSGHGHTVQLFDARSMDRVKDLWPGGKAGGRSVGRSGEEVVGIHLDGHKVVSASAHGLISVWDVRASPHPLLTKASIREGLLSPLGAMHVDGEWLVAAGQERCVHVLPRASASDEVATEADDPPRRVLLDPGGRRVVATTSACMSAVAIT